MLAYDSPVIQQVYAMLIPVVVRVTDMRGRIAAILFQRDLLVPG